MQNMICGAYPLYEEVPMWTYRWIKSKVDANLEKVSKEIAYYPRVQGDESLKNLQQIRLHLIEVLRPIKIQ